MAAFTTVLANAVNLPMGPTAFGPQAVDNDVAWISLTIDRSQWTDPAAGCTAVVTWSNTNRPFQPLCAISSPGGSGHGTNTVTMVKLPPGLSRRVQGTYTVSGVRFTSTLTLQGIL